MKITLVIILIVSWIFGVSVGYTAEKPPEKPLSGAYRTQFPPEPKPRVKLQLPPEPKPRTKRGKKHIKSEMY
jgi:hypothetical protein